MKISLLKIVFIIQLFGAVVILSILPSNASAWVNVGIEDLCCNNSESNGHTDTDPCSTPVCSCVFCMDNYLVISHPISSTSLGKVYCHSDQQSFQLPEFISSIDYPPEIL
jgi:hypothetical protein